MVCVVGGERISLGPRRRVGEELPEPFVVTARHNLYDLGDGPVPQRLSFLDDGIRRSS